MWVLRHIDKLYEVRRIKDARGIIQKAKAVISQRPEIIATDKGQFYKKAIKREFVGMHRYMTRNHKLAKSISDASWREGHSRSHAQGDMASAPQKEDAGRIAESGTISGVSR